MSSGHDISADVLANAHEAFGVALEGISRLSLSENRMRPWANLFDARQVTRFIEMAASYGDPSCTALRDVLSEYLRVPREHLLVTNGSDEALLLIAASRLGFDEIVVFEKTFAGHELCGSVSGLRTSSVPLIEGSQEIRIDPRVRAKRNSIILICDPHNPSGMSFNRDDVLELFSMARAHNNLMVLDEAYVEFCGDPRGYLDYWADGAIGDRVVILRSLSKFWGLAGLRCGYIIARPSFLSRLELAKSLIPYSVNRVVSALACAIVKETHFRQLRDLHATAKHALRETLDRRELVYLPSVTNFFCVQWPSEADIVRRMLHHKLLVKDLATSGRPGWFRVSTGSGADLSRLSGFLE